MAGAKYGKPEPPLTTDIPTRMPRVLNSPDYKHEKYEVQVKTRLHRREKIKYCHAELIAGVTMQFGVKKHSSTLQTLTTTRSESRLKTSFAACPSQRFIKD